MTGGEIQSVPHTKGPWKFAPISDKFGYGDELRVVQEGSETHPQGELLIARVNPFLADESRYNAQLIATAPELLAVLQHIVTEADTDKNDTEFVKSLNWKRIRLTLHKAKKLIR